MILWSRLELWFQVNILEKRLPLGDLAGTTVFARDLSRDNVNIRLGINIISVDFSLETQTIIILGIL